jgi:hypothetical protein
MTNEKERMSEFELRQAYERVKDIDPHVVFGENY